jgi:hypothetical protein
MTNLGDGRIGMKCLSAGPYLFRFLGLLKMKSHQLHIYFMALQRLPILHSENVLQCFMNISVVNEISITPLSCMGEWRYSSTILDLSNRLKVVWPASPATHWI